MRPGAFERLSPPWEDVRILETWGRPDEPGFRALISVPAGPFRRKWLAEHRDVEPGTMFRDVQIDGPFARWEHTHRFTGNGSSSVLSDEIQFELPYGALGRLANGAVQRALERLFHYRHETTRNDLKTHLRYRLPPSKILVTGSTGLVGSVLCPFLTTGGHEVVRLRRDGATDPAAFDGVDAVVHLAGENIASGRWTKARKARIRESRTNGTRVLSERLAKLSVKPKVLVSASAIGFYGDRGSEPLEETSAPGSGFLASVCQEWEASTRPAREAGIRVVHLRTGIVLSPSGGALARMLLPFRFGVGGRVGSGEQFMSFVSIDDLVSVVLHAIATETLDGPLNAVSPHPVSNREFTATLSDVLRRPAFLPVPRFAIRAALGEMADALLLSSARVIPRKLLDSSYEFRHPKLQPALRHVLGRRASS